MRFSFLALPLLWAAPSLAALTYKGVDWTSLLHEERDGRQYRNAAGTVQPLETILKDNGVNTVRQRIWVNPPNGRYNLEYNLELGRRAKAAGLKIYLDFHYSDDWADPGKQVKPAAWASLSDDALMTRIWEYTRDVMNAFQNAGIPLALVSIGNEITPGLLFPTGQVSQPNGPRNAARLLKSAANGIRESSISPKPKIMVHLDNGWNWDTQLWWYDLILNSGGGFTTSDFDVQGVSYYPFYNSAATLASLGTSLKNMAARWGKEVQVVETNWPSWCDNPQYQFPSDTRNIPISAAGQTTWIGEVAKRVAAVSGGKGNGLFYWEPAWISNPGLGSSCGWNLMVGSDGKVMEGMAAFRNI
ncbi:arabinogalactan endo-1,4-beta-galactosidase-like protein [Corynespora cassiicola Philippines]|uniref:Arabinogalactan endo-beta-1,4-galactanase n=1 Tax=Corynespora cassiicola Philippines TaxID=1448308 RepID=A0A2T2NR53_CORCC|nr:arabinogalactan endo-1,4-beta-galactosidase-like protein [Corynespora cassiicola Philippines]